MSDWADDKVAEISRLAPQVLDNLTRLNMAAALRKARDDALEEAKAALYSAPRYDQEIFDSMTQMVDGSWVKVEDAESVIDALKDKPPKAC